MVGFGPTTSGEKKKAKNSKDKKLEITYHESQDNFFEEPQPIILDMPDRSAETTVPVDITSSIELGVNEETLISGEETKRNNIFLVPVTELVDEPDDEIFVDTADIQNKIPAKKKERKSVILPKEPERERNLKSENNSYDERRYVITHMSGFTGRSINTVKTAYRKVSQNKFIGLALISLVVSMIIACVVAYSLLLRAKKAKELMTTERVRFSNNLKALQTSFQIDLSIVDKQIEEIGLNDRPEEAKVAYSPLTQAMNSFDILKTFLFRRSVVSVLETISILRSGTVKFVPEIELNSLAEHQELPKEVKYGLAVQSMIRGAHDVRSSEIKYIPRRVRKGSTSIKVVQMDLFECVQFLNPDITKTAVVLFVSPDAPPNDFLSLTNPVSIALRRTGLLAPLVSRIIILN